MSVLSLMQEKIASYHKLYDEIVSKLNENEPSPDDEMQRLDELRFFLAECGLVPHLAGYPYLSEDKQGEILRECAMYRVAKHRAESNPQASEGEG